jgi:hypothetical protein
LPLLLDLLEPLCNPPLSDLSGCPEDAFFIVEVDVTTFSSTRKLMSESALPVRRQALPDCRSVLTI